MPHVIDRGFVAEAAAQQSCVGIDEQFMGIKAVSVLRRIGAVDAVTVALAGLCPGEQGVPDIAGPEGNVEPRLFPITIRVEKTQLYGLSMGRVKCEINPISRGYCSQLLWVTRLEPHDAFLC